MLLYFSETVFIDATDEEINFAFNGFRGGELIQWNERQKNSSRSTENCKRVEEDIINSV